VRHRVLVAGLVVAALVVALLALLVVRRVGGTSDDYLGSQTNPMTIEPGKAFDVHGYRFAAGWQVGTDADGHATVTGLSVTNDRGHDDLAFETIRLVSGYEVRAQLTCTTTGPRIAAGETVTFSCTSDQPLPDDYAKVTIQETY
jgi:hypothetical protein